MNNINDFHKNIDIIPKVNYFHTYNKLNRGKMDFHKLETTTKVKLHNELLSYASKMGGVNFFLQLIEDINKEPTNILLNKTATARYSKGKITWKKQIYKDTLNLLYNYMKKEEDNQNIYEDMRKKEKKATINMLKTLKPIEIEVTLKNQKDGEGFKFNIIETKEEDSSVTDIFKVLFFYNINFAKKALKYQPEEL